MQVAYESHPVPILYYADGISHILSLYSTMMVAYESHPVPVLYHAEGI